VTGHLVSHLLSGVALFACFALKVAFRTAAFEYFTARPRRPDTSGVGSTVRRGSMICFDELLDTPKADWARKQIPTSGARASSRQQWSPQICSKIRSRNEKRCGSCTVFVLHSYRGGSVCEEPHCHKKRRHHAMLIAFVAALAIGSASSLSRDVVSTSTVETMTLCVNCSDDSGCSKDRAAVVYHPPVGRCFSPPKLYPDDPAWGPSDVRDSCKAADGDSRTYSTSLVREFFNTTDGSCGGEPTDSYELPLGTCVGPFGKPRPWGVFECSQNGTTGR